MAKEKLALSAMLSTVYGTLLSGIAGLLLLKWVANWSHATEMNKFWVVLASTCALILPVSGFIYTAKGWRIFGIIHTALMIGIAGLFLYQGITAMASAPGPGNPVAGFVIAIDFACIFAGVLAAICGAAVMRCLFPRQEKSTPER